ncbi:hypothetical protein [Luteibacter sahnii]|uniref:hypothetical protein n=1 Tax=Luteibacter sahnii TaxID=3021977 RepID=UPI002A69FC84|nr:hypothetical protein [Luteibacter sp. PPL193]MDY1549542.1 hypothetical protein [Luteibacter sp. PPL193]
MQNRPIKALLFATLVLAATACSQQKDTDRAVPGGNTAGTATSAAPASGSTAGQSR